MFYHLELQISGAILLAAMTLGGIAMWLRRRRLRRDPEAAENDDTQNP